MGRRDLLGRGYDEAPVLPQRPGRAARRGALALAALLVAYGNLVSLLPAESRERFDWAYMLGNLAVMGLLLLWATKWAGLSLATIGWTRRSALKAAAQGAALAALVSVPVVVYFAFPLIIGGPIRHDRLESWSSGDFLAYALLREPLGTALFEETAFRGVLQAKMIQAFAVRRGIAATALSFVLWHLVINYRTIQETNLGDSLALGILAQAGSMVGLAMGSVLLGLLRHSTGNLAAPTAFHWLVNVAMTGSLWGLSR